MTSKFKFKYGTRQVKKDLSH